MKQFLIVCAVLMAADVFAKDMLTEIQGKWKPDIKATKNLPEIKKQLADKKKAPMLNMVLGMLDSSVIEFTKDSMVTAITVEDDTQKQTTKFKVIKNTPTLLVIADERGEKMYVSKKGKHIFMKDTEGNKPSKRSPPILLSKAK